jgi:hypothetical protein
MRISKGLLWKILIPVGVLLTGTVVFQSWIQSASTQNRIREELSRNLGMEIKFEKIRTSLRKGLRIKGLTGSNPQGSSLRSREVQIRPGLLPLLLGKLSLSSIHVDSLNLVWVEAPSETKTESPAATPAPDSNPLNHLIQDSPGKKINLGRIVVDNADLQWISRSGQSVLQLEGISLQIQSDPQGNGSGRLMAAKGVLLETLAFHAIQAPIKLEKGTLSLPNLSCKSGGGQISASAEAFLIQQGIPFGLKLSLQDVDLARNNSETPAIRLSGIANGQIDLRGTSLRSEAITGSGSLRLQDGFFKGLSLLQILGQIFQIHELANLKIRQGDAQFQISDRKIHLAPLTLRSDELQLESRGSVDFEKQLALDARLAIPERLLKNQNFQSFFSRFSPPDEQGKRAIDFRITGSLEKPRTDLVEKIVSGGAGNLLQQVIGNFLKPKSPPTKQDSSGPAPDANAGTPGTPPANR